MSTESDPGVDMIQRLAAVMKLTEFAWTLCLVGEDHAGKLAELAGDLNDAYSETGDGKQIASGFSYWGIEPTVAWARAVSDPLYPVARSSIESFYPRWREATTSATAAGPLPSHYVSFGPGTGEKDHAILRTLRRNGRIDSYIPVDMSAEMLRRAVHESIADETVARELIIPVQLDFADAANLTELRNLLDIVTQGAPVLFSLLGNTVSNFPDVRAFLTSLAELMRPDDRFVIEAATTRELTGAWAEAAAKEYRRSAAFRSFVTSSLIHYTSLQFDMDNVSFEGSIEGDDALLIKVIYRNNSDEVIRFALPDQSLVTFKPKDTIRLHMMRKFLRDTLPGLLRSCALDIVAGKVTDFPAGRSGPPFGMDLYILKRVADTPEEPGLAGALWPTRG